MKTKTIAISLMLTFTTGALFAKSPTENVFPDYKIMDSIPTRDTIAKKDSTVSLSNNANQNLTAYNYSNLVKRDTVLSPKDTIPKKDSLVTINNNSNNNLTALNYSNLANRDTVPSPKDSIPKKDSTQNLSSNLNLHSTLNSISENNSELEKPMKKDEPVYSALRALEIYKPI